MGLVPAQSTSVDLALCVEMFLSFSIHEGVFCNIVYKLVTLYLVLSPCTFAVDIAIPLHYWFGHWKDVWRVKTCYIYPKLGYQT